MCPKAAPVTNARQSVGCRDAWTKVRSLVISHHFDVLEVYIGFQLWRIQCIEAILPIDPLDDDPLPSQRWERVGFGQRHTFHRRQTPGLPAARTVSTQA